MARAIVSAGGRVALWGRGTNHPVDAAAEKLAADLDAERDSVIGITVDTNDEKSVETAWDETVTALGTPNILVNGVGGNSSKSAFVDIEVDEFKNVLSLNIIAGLVVPLKVCARRWIEASVSASVINVASMASYTPLSGVWAYDAAKAAVKNLTEGAAKEFAPHGIRVNAVAPGFFLGYQNRSLLIANNDTGELTERGKSIIARTPAGRFGSAEEIEGVTVFLADDAASGFVTGVTIPVDGGYQIDNI